MTTINAALGALLLADKVVDSNIKSIGTASKAVAIKAQETAVSILVKSLPMDMGGVMDASKALPLVLAMHDGMRKNALRSWFERYSNIRLTTSKDKDGKLSHKCKLLGPKDDGYRVLTVANVLAASNKNFWELVALEGVDTIVDDMWLAKRLASLVKQIDTAKAEGRLSIVVPADLAVIETLRKQSETVKERATRAALTAGKVAASAAMQAKAA